MPRAPPRRGARSCRRGSARLPGARSRRRRPGTAAGRSAPALSGRIRRASPRGSPAPPPAQLLLLFLGPTRRGRFGRTSLLLRRRLRGAPSLLRRGRRGLALGRASTLARGGNRRFHLRFLGDGRLLFLHVARGAAATLGGRSRFLLRGLLARRLGGFFRLR